MPFVYSFVKYGTDKYGDDAMSLYYLQKKFTFAKSSQAWAQAAIICGMTVNKESTEFGVITKLFPRLPDLMADASLVQSVLDKASDSQLTVMRLRYMQIVKESMNSALALKPWELLELKPGEEPHSCHASSYNRLGPVEAEFLSRSRCVRFIKVGGKLSRGLEIANGIAFDDVEVSTDKLESFPVPSTVWPDLKLLNVNANAAVLTRFRARNVLRFTRNFRFVNGKTIGDAELLEMMRCVLVMFGLAPLTMQHMGWGQPLKLKFKASLLVPFLTIIGPESRIQLLLVL